MSALLALTDSAVEAVKNILSSSDEVAETGLLPGVELVREGADGIEAVGDRADGRLVLLDMNRPLLDGFGAAGLIASTSTNPADPASQRPI